MKAPEVDDNVNTLKDVVDDQTSVDEEHGKDGRLLHYITKNNCKIIACCFMIRNDVKF